MAESGKIKNSFFRVIFCVSKNARSCMSYEKVKWKMSISAMFPWLTVEMPTQQLAKCWPYETEKGQLRSVARMCSTSLLGPMATNDSQVWTYKEGLAQERVWLQNHILPLLEEKKRRKKKEIKKIEIWCRWDPNHLKNMSIEIRIAMMIWCRCSMRMWKWLWEFVILCSNFTRIFFSCLQNLKGKETTNFIVQ